jgi:hypothetical protein
MFFRLQTSTNAYRIREAAAKHASIPEALILANVHRGMSWTPIVTLAMVSEHGPLTIG